MADSIRVLLVDDQAFVGDAVRRMLADEVGVEFHFCQDPALAIEAANSYQPTVILQDLVMPEIDGLLLLKFFRANPTTRDTPMIVLSSKEEPVIKAKALYEGKYPLVSALSRPLIVKHQVAMARKYGADGIAHGCTGKGNDQVRFEVSSMALAPDHIAARSSGLANCSCLSRGLRRWTRNGVPSSVSVVLAVHRHQPVWATNPSRFASLRNQKSITFDLTSS